MSFALPDGLTAAAADDPHTAAWVAGLAERVAAAAAQWSLQLGDPFRPGGMTAWVAPARTSAGEDVVVKIARRHFESEQEIDGLRVWDGRGTVRLLDAGPLDEHTDVLLLEPCRPGTSATELPALECDELVAITLRRMWSSPVTPSSFRPLSRMCAYWLDALDRDDATARIGDAGIVRAGCELVVELAAGSGDDVLLATDLHAGNILRAEREPWLAIDPKPFHGDRTFDALQHLLNDADRALADIEGWLTRTAGLLDLDRDRLRQWLFARCVVEVRWFEVAAQLARLLAR